jgi:hypothetical protein
MEIEQSNNQAMIDRGDVMVSKEVWRSMLTARTIVQKQK